MKVTKTIKFDAAHRLPYHCGRCSNIHGHSFVLNVSLESKSLYEEGSSSGMVYDFKNIKQILMDKIDCIFDHSLILFYKDIFCKNICEMFNIKEEDFNSFLDYLDNKPYSLVNISGNRFNITNFIPTSENLCAYIFKTLYPLFIEENIILSEVELYETSTSKATFTLDDAKSYGII